MTLSEIIIFPVKGMRGVSVASSMVEPRGLSHDRRYLVVDADGLFVSQRGDPVLATVVPTVIEDGLRLSCNGLAAVECAPTDRRSFVTVWKSHIDAVDCGDPVADWLSQLLGKSCRLVAMDATSRRDIDPDYGRPGEQVSFADGFPLLLANQSSLEDLNRRMDVALPMNRFRPNVVVSGGEPWAEDGWEALRIGTVEFRSVKPCARCLVTTTDQLTGERMGEEPLRTMATFRNVGGKAMFGMNLIPNEIGTISLGDSVSVLRA